MLRLVWGKNRFAKIIWLMTNVLAQLTLLVSILELLNIAASYTLVWLSRYVVRLPPFLFRSRPCRSRSSVLSPIAIGRHD